MLTRSHCRDAHGVRRALTHPDTGPNKVAGEWMHGDTSCDPFNGFIYRHGRVCVELPLQWGRLAGQWRARENHVNFLHALSVEGCSGVCSRTTWRHSSCSYVLIFVSLFGTDSHHTDMDWTQSHRTLATTRGRTCRHRASTGRVVCHLTDNCVTRSFWLRRDSNDIKRSPARCEQSRVLRAADAQQYSRRNEEQRA